LTTDWQPSLGAVAGPGSTIFRVWAPRPARVDLVLREGDDERVLPMQRDGEYWALEVPGAGAGHRYGYLLDGQGPFPDPCSRSQPEGVHALSEIVDPAAFAWHDRAFPPPDVADLVIYEAHAGTLTTEGTFEAAARELPRLADLGVTAIEIMPVAAFPGRWNWGYDGVALFAPAAVYGGPDGLRGLVDEAHRAGLAVILDVVYNHFGPDGNYTSLYSERYLTSRHTTPWGDAVNFDDAGSAEVRRFFVENILHWTHEYHIDGFRLDATHAIHDDSPVHILADLRLALEQHPRAGRVPYLIAETDENDVRYLRSVAEGGYGLDAVWADDFHHVVRTLLRPEREGYLAAFEGTAGELARVIGQGFLFEGQDDPFSGRPRGTPAREQPWRQFVYCLQNHDQVGNRAFGDRLNDVAARADLLAATLLLLLLPQTPLLFQGQEFLASTPFLYFTDHEPELGRLVTEGRRSEFGAFTAFSDPVLRERIPDPQDPLTFCRSRLHLDEAETGLRALAVDFHRELLGLRRDDAVLADARRERWPVRAISRDRAVLVEMGGPSPRWLAANFGELVEFELECSEPDVIIHSAEPRFGGNGMGPEAAPRRVGLPPHTAAFLRPASERGAGLRTLR
jgi:maltooligosyltrehalose trehalohydrolase